MGKRHRSGRRLAQVRKQRRETVYKMKRKRCYGVVPCFVCSEHVQEEHATLEHVLPLSRGGSDAMDNLDISHSWCNHARGAADGC